MAYFPEPVDRKAIVESNDTNIRKKTAKQSIPTSVVADNLDSVLSYVDSAVAARTSRLIDLGAWGIKADGVLDDKGVMIGGTDNGPRFMELQKELSSRHEFFDQPHYDFLYPSNKQANYTGVVGARFSPYLYNMRHILVDVNGCKLISYIPEAEHKQDNMYQRVNVGHNGELLSINTVANEAEGILGYKGTKYYMNTPAIDNAYAGQMYLDVLNPASLNPRSYYKGARICPNDKDVAKGYPRASKQKQVVRIISVNYTTGRIFIDQPLKYNYLRNRPNLNNTEGGLSGPATIIPLDHYLRRYCQYAKFIGGTMLPASPDARETFAFTAEVVELQEMIAYKQVTPTECLRLWLAKHCFFPDQMEFDKLLDLVQLFDTHLGKYASNAGGANRVEIIGGSTGTTLQLCAPEMLIKNVALNAADYVADEHVKPTPKIGETCLQSYPGFQPLNLVELESCTFSIANNAEACVDLAGLQQYTVTAVDAAGRMREPWNGDENEPSFKLYKSLDLGMSMYAPDGTAVGRVNYHAFEPSQPDCTRGFIVVGLTGAPLAVGQVKQWSTLRNLRNKGGHTIQTPGKNLFAAGTLPWISNREAGTRPPVIELTDQDLQPNKQLKIDFYGIVTGFELVCTPGQPTGDLRLSINTETKYGKDQNNNDLYGKMVTKLGLSTSAVRRVDAYGNMNNVVRWVYNVEYPNEREPFANSYDPTTVGVHCDKMSLYYNCPDLSNRTPFRFKIYGEAY